VRLIGPDALPDEQRLVLVTADLIKTGFLQQSSFDEVDKYCPPAKQILLLRIMIEFHRRSEAAIKAGAPLMKIQSLPIKEGIARLKSDMPNDKPELLKAFLAELGKAFDDLDSQYRKEALQ
jgi:V/A-type H+-transporting ATPase subunit A